MFKSATVAISAALLSFVLVGCGGSGNIGTNAGTPTPTPTPTPTDPTAPVTPVYAMGTLNGSTFTANAIQITTANVAAGGSTGLKVDIVDTANSNQLVANQGITINFSSPCASSGQSTITSPVTTVTGTATSTYGARGCSGSDSITATATVGTQNLVAVGSVTVAPSPIGSIQFTSVTPNAIRIRGTGDPQTAVVLFTARNTAGGPVQNQAVRFALDTTAGGITFTPATAVTDSNGVAQTTVASGTVSTSVRVTATALDGSGAAVAGVPPAQSDSLVISTGLADQNSFSLSAGCFNIEGGDIDGVTTPINILAADRFNNPVPDGTAIAFRAEGGQIAPQCLTTSGACSVNFTSASPRPANGRATVLATAVGEESFTDVNGNGQYDSGEAFTDLTEAFLDRNEDGTRNNDEEFVDFNNNGNFNVGSGNFTGVLCASGCDTATAVSVRSDLPITLSGSTANLLVTPSTVDLSNGPVAVQVTMGDRNDQPMPSGTTLAATTSFGTIVGDATFTQACSAFNGPFVYTFVIEPPDDQDTADSGVMSIKATSPRGVVSSTSVSVTFTPPAPVTPTPPAPGPLRSISTLSTTPTLISLRGTGAGAPETSAVTFEVRDDQGNALSGQVVNFTTDTTAGGITLDKTSATSDSTGAVLVNLSAGTVQTTVRVLATATSGATSVNASSDPIVISTTIPDQDSVSLSALVRNIEGRDFDGETAAVTIRLADRFNNPAPDGTQVSFTIEGGAITPSCVLNAGSCNVTITSQNPRVADGRYTVLATVSAEESFTDLNGNGRYDSGEPFGDLAEAFQDRNENGVRDAASEPFVDFNNNGLFDAASGNFTGVLCNSGCDANARFVSGRASFVIVFAGSDASIGLSPGTLTFATATDSPRTVNVTVQDVAGNPMPAGTTIVATTDYGSVSGDGGVASYEQRSSTAPGSTQVYRFVVSPDQTTPAKQGTVTVTVTTPNGIVTRAFIRIN